MDRLAARGIRFERAYCTYPLCGPTRASQHTGRYPHQWKINDNGDRFFWYMDIPREACLGWHMTRAGYECVWSGKDMPPDDGSRDFVVLHPWSDPGATQAMADYLRQDRPRPFLACLNLLDLHDICEHGSQRTLQSQSLGEEPPLADMPTLPTNFHPPTEEPEVIRIAQQTWENVYLPQNFSVDEWRRYLWTYYRMVERADNHLGLVLDALEESGKLDNTLVIFTSDHGDGSAAHQWNQKSLFYEEIIRVPLIMAGPGIAAGRVEHRLAGASLDLMPTILEMAGVPIPSTCEGRSLWGLARGEAPSDWREALVVETSLGGATAGEIRRNRGRCVVTETMKYSLWIWGRNREHLVDLAADPGEMINLASSSRHRETLEQMRTRLAQWCRATADAFQVPGHEDIGSHHGWAEVETNRKRFSLGPRQELP